MELLAIAAVLGVLALPILVVAILCRLSATGKPSATGRRATAFGTGPHTASSPAAAGTPTPPA